MSRPCPDACGSASLGALCSRRRGVRERAHARAHVRPRPSHVCFERRTQARVGVQGHVRSHAHACTVLSRLCMCVGWIVVDASRLRAQSFNLTQQNAGAFLHVGHPKGVQKDGAYARLRGRRVLRFGPRLVWARCTHVLASVLACLGALVGVLCVRALACGRVYAVWVLGAS